MPSSLKRTNYQFIEWNTKADGTGTTFTKDATIPEVMSVYAIWGKVPIAPEDETNYDPIVTTTNTGQTPTTIPDNKVPKTGQNDVVVGALFSLVAMILYSGVILLKRQKA